MIYGSYVKDYTCRKQKEHKMTIERGHMICNLYQGAFSGEVVFQVETFNGESYEGIAPKQYAVPVDKLSADPIPGRLHVRMIRNGGGKVRVRMPDGEAIDVAQNAIELSKK